MEGKDILDIGCGDGIISLGIARNTRPRSVLALDLVEVDLSFLNDQATANSIERYGLSDSLKFAISTPNVIPVSDESFDIVTAWSVFEHVDSPVDLLHEIFRSLKPGGSLFIQVWPLWFSEHGSHLWPFFDETFVQLTRTDSEIESHLGTRFDDPEIATSFFDLFKSCNKTTVDDLQIALLDAGFFIGRCELDGASIHVPASLQRVPLSKHAVQGVKLIAVKP